jgi:hypothetical protein
MSLAAQKGNFRNICSVQKNLITQTMTTCGAAVDMTVTWRLNP